MNAGTVALILVHQKTGQRYPLRDDFTIGRTDGHLVFDHDPKLSGKHCLIRLTETGYAIYDLKTRTGVFVNGIRIPEGKACILHMGDELTIGDQTFAVVQNPRFAKQTSAHFEKESYFSPRTMALLVTLLAVSGILLLALPKYMRLPSTSAVSPPANSTTNAINNLDAEMREAISRYDYFNQYMRKGNSSSDYEQNLNYVRDELIPRFTSLHNQLQTTPAPKDAAKAKRMDLDRRRAGAILGKLTALSQFLETRDHRFSNEVSEYERQLNLLNEEIHRVENRQPGSSSP